ncbi:ethanolamine ammonia-lyase [Rhodospirillum rubrum]|uniref:ethanolamine ammonia-lyase subunit EutC n=1 Tax=Rhodospirillum rubrum TaxID=1085 RepID=UPI0019065FF5|nr:ethanolamine ammonia-lyase subunit EutC [Rhodospirillum rubrum]MBK1665359.1 ethanolamine ammonia-lyase [Rhodospirillum rubrum]MBK1678021.1 ethanolamine ammonia-lyase [Rhodospirillum rubrum]
MTLPPVVDPFARFRAATRARVGLGRSGDALPTTALLEFQIAHARARDAVHGAIDAEALARAFAPLPTATVHSAASDRAVYLRRPDLGRRLDDESAARLDALGEAGQGWDVVFVIADGLSAAAVAAHAQATVRAALETLGGRLSVGPLVIASQSRVALGDDIGARLKARMVAVLIGERPGLSVADSLGVYITFDPRPGRRDSERNCISNIHADGLHADQAARTLCWLVEEGLRRRITGIGLKEEAQPRLGAGEGGNLPPVLDPSDRLGELSS